VKQEGLKKYHLLLNWIGIKALVLEQYEMVWKVEMPYPINNQTFKTI